MTDPSKPTPISSLIDHVRDNPGKLRQMLNPQARAMIEKLVAKGREQMPEDYDVESAFADVLSLGAVELPTELQPGVLRLAVWLFDRLPREEGAG